MKTPMDKESGKLLMDFKLAKTFHEAAKRNLPSNVAIATNPLEMEVLNVKSNTSESMSDLVLKNAIDKDKNGVLDENEVQNFTKALDASNDGKVSRKEAKAFNVLYRLNVIQNTVFGNVVTGVVGHTCIRIFSQETLKGRNILVKYPFVVYIGTIS